MNKISKISSKRYYKSFSLVVLSMQIFTAIFATNVFAQISSSGVATTAVVIEDAPNGSVICTREDGNIMCSSEFDPSMYGVVSDTPAAAIVDDSLENGRLVIRNGIAEIRVTTQAGDISSGDLLTSSSINGVAQKATKNGYVIGISLDNYSASEVGVIQAMINIHPTTSLSGQRGNVLQFIRQGLAVPIFQPLESLRYLLAVLIIIISFTLGMVYFGRASRAGIEAIGRNPLARKVIQLTVILNIILTIVIVLVGLAIAYLILAF
jgi:F0F1-type ATP synthase membrane subunit c/vacuolar-type H+-ATPase subunit K